MKNTIITIIAMLALTVTSINAQSTNKIVAPVLSVDSTINTNADNVTTNDANQGSDNYELTFGGGGITSPKNGNTQFGLDVSLSTHLFDSAPNLWVGAAQNLSWEPSFAGETDIFSDYSWHLAGQLYLNTGWSVGLSYAANASSIWHTGPEASLEWYVDSSTFLFAGPNLDLVSNGNTQINWKAGIGWNF